MGKQLGRLITLILGRQPVKEKENSEFRPDQERDQLH